MDVLLFASGKVFFLLFLVIYLNNGVVNTAKAWVNFYGVPSTPTYNISSISKLSTGRYRV